VQGDLQQSAGFSQWRRAERNLDLATTLACRLDGAPAEEDGRLGPKPVMISDISLAAGR